MAELLVAFIQSLCLCGYLYGAWLVITHAAGGDPRRGGTRRHSAPRIEFEDVSAWRRYLAYDS